MNARDMDELMSWMNKNRGFLFEMPVCCSTLSNQMVTLHNRFDFWNKVRFIYILWRLKIA